MMLIEETNVAVAALPVDAFKAHLRMGSGFAEDAVQDAVLEGFLRAALAAIEARTGKVLLQRDFVWNLTAWRDGQAQALPVAPVVSVNVVETQDRLGTITVSPVTAYRLKQDDQVPMLCALGGALPTIPSGGCVDIRFTAGLAANWDGLPADLAQAVMLLGAHYYEYRNETALSAGCMPFGMTSLIERYRRVRLTRGGGQ